nr:hypothetical protein [Tanacetum cinerariifolium]
MEHEEVPNRCDDEKDGDNHQEKGDLLNFPIFPVTNEFANVFKQVEENINVNTAREMEDVHKEDVEMDKNHDIDHSNTKEDSTARGRNIEITLPGG